MVPTGAGDPAAAEHLVALGTSGPLRLRGRDQLVGGVLWCALREARPSGAGRPAIGPNEPPVLAAWREPSWPCRGDGGPVLQRPAGQRRRRASQLGRSAGRRQRVASTTHDRRAVDPPRTTIASRSTDGFTGVRNASRGARRATRGTPLASVPPGFTWVDRSRRRRAPRSPRQTSVSGRRRRLRRRGGRRRVAVARYRAHTSSGCRGQRDVEPQRLPVAASYLPAPRRVEFSRTPRARRGRVHCFTSSRGVVPLRGSPVGCGDLADVRPYRIPRRVR